MALRFSKEKFMQDLNNWAFEHEKKEYEDDVANGTSWICDADGQIVNPSTWSLKTPEGRCYSVVEDWCEWDESSDKDVARAIKRHKERGKLNDATKEI